MRFHFSLAVPIICSLVSTILALLVLFAGNSPNFMEDAHIIMLNTSGLGKDIVPTGTSGGSQPSPTSDGCGLGGVFGKICGSATSAVASVATQAAGAIDNVEDDLADKLAAKLGIKQFYSLHLMDACEGYFTPNATAKDAGFNVSSCTQPLKTADLNVAEKIQDELNKGPLKLHLSDLGFAQDLEDEFNKIPRLVMALAVVYMIGGGLAALSLLGSLAGLTFMASSKLRLGAIANLGLAGAASLFLLIGSLTTTVGAKEAADKIDGLGGHIGLHASAGTKFMAMTWATFGLMAIAAAYWTYEFIFGNRRRRGGHMDEKYDDRRFSGDSYNPRLSGDSFNQPPLPPPGRPQFPPRY